MSLELFMESSKVTEVQKVSMAFYVKPWGILSHLQVFLARPTCPKLTDIARHFIFGLVWPCDCNDHQWALCKKIQSVFPVCVPNVNDAKNNYISIKYKMFFFQGRNILEQCDTKTIHSLIGPMLPCHSLVTVVISVVDFQFLPKLFCSLKDIHPKKHKSFTLILSDKEGSKFGRADIFQTRSSFLLKQLVIMIWINVSRIKEDTTKFVVTV